MNEHLSLILLALAPQLSETDRHTLAEELDHYLGERLSELLEQQQRMQYEQGRRPGYGGGFGGSSLRRGL